MAAVAGITLVKTFPYRGDPNEEYSNQYWFTGAVPADGTAWEAFARALIAEERHCYHSEVRVSRAYGYDDNGDDATAVWSMEFAGSDTTLYGNLTGGNSKVVAGDASAWVRWKTSRMNSKGKPIYLRKYFHPAYAAGTSSADADVLYATYKTNLDNLGAALMGGAFDGGRTLRSREHDETLQSTSSSVYITTRTLKRRGKRPNS